MWSGAFGGAEADMPYALAVDSGGNAFVSGYFAATIDFGTGPLTAINGDDMFVAKIGP